MYTKLVPFVHTVPYDSPLRLDAYSLGIIPNCITRTQSKKWIKAGHILINDVNKPPSYFPKKDDILVCIPPPDKTSTYTIPLDVLFEDDFCAVVYKPAGLYISGNYAHTLRRALIHNLTQSSEFTRLPQPEPVHRLDRRTSGLVLVAKTSIAAHRLSEAFAQRDIKKTYRALVLGKAHSGHSDLPIDGKEAYTNWIVKDVGRSLHTQYNTILEVYPHTGRTHQIRKHLHAAGFPILGDDLYHNDLVRTDKGLFLSAIGLKFTHPLSGEPIEISVEQPPKFANFLTKEHLRYMRTFPLEETKIL